jgi:anthranilate synthase component I
LILTSTFTKGAYERVVERAKEYIRAGDIIQVVPSQRLEAAIDVDPFDIYRTLRTVNPSPYMFYLKFRDLRLVGSSPEVNVRLEGSLIELRPLAGTRRRGRHAAEDLEITAELMQDPKERAEHIMLVDLGRNDVGRVAKIGSVKVTELLQVEKYSHVMHLVSHVVGELVEGKDCYDVMRATFPQGTVSGAPKIRAMEIIEELEPTKRGPYAGAVGYFSYSGNMDTCIALRTMTVKGNTAFVQAGGGVVADSVPELEYEETLNKARALMRAIELARAGIE